jgi:hypothetical protein
MKAIKVISVVCIGLALLLVIAARSAQAQYYYPFNPLLLPFYVAGAAVGTAAAIVTGVVPGPYYPYPRSYGPAYYAPAPVRYAPGPYYSRSTWIPAHYNRYGRWIPGHWR